MKKSDALGGSATFDAGPCPATTAVFASVADAPPAVRIARAS